MARIVLGLATSHGPMLSTPPEQWDARVPADRQARHHFRGRTFTFDGLVALRAGENLASQITPQRWRERHAACQRAIARLADIFHSAKPDVTVIVATIRALKMHGGVAKDDLKKENLEALKKGLSNLQRHVSNEIGRAHV